jgi:Cutinase
LYGTPINLLPRMNSADFKEGISTGQMLCDLLKKKYGNKVGCQGIDPKGYSANLADNRRPKGTADASIEAGVKEFNNAYNKCPKSRFVFTGFR